MSEKEVQHPTYQEVIEQNRDKPRFVSFQYNGKVISYEDWKRILHEKYPWLRDKSLIPEPFNKYIHNTEAANTKSCEIL
jgi:hypothetical protein